MRRTRNDDNLLQEIIDAAERHGRISDLDHEVGDLQDALRAAWELLAPSQAVLHHSHFRDHERWDDDGSSAAEAQ